MSNDEGQPQNHFFYFSRDFELGQINDKIEVGKKELCVCQKLRIIIR